MAKQLELFSSMDLEKLQKEPKENENNKYVSSLLDLGKGVLEACGSIGDITFKLGRDPITCATVDEHLIAPKLKQSAMSCTLMSALFRVNRIEYLHSYISEKVREHLREAISSEGGLKKVERELLKRYNTYNQTNFSYVADYLTPDYDVTFHILYDEFLKSYGEDLEKDINIDKRFYPSVEMLEEMREKRVSNLYEDFQDVEIWLANKYFDNLKKAVKKCEKGNGKFGIVVEESEINDPGLVYYQVYDLTGGVPERATIVFPNDHDRYKKYKKYEKEGIAAIVPVTGEELGQGWLEEALINNLDKNPLTTIILNDPEVRKKYFGKFSRENPQTHTVCLLNKIEGRIFPYDVVLPCVPWEEREVNTLWVFDSYFGKVIEMDGDYVGLMRREFLTIEPPKGFKRYKRQLYSKARDREFILHELQVRAAELIKKYPSEATNILSIFQKECRNYEPIHRQLGLFPYRKSSHKVPRKSRKYNIKLYGSPEDSSVPF